MSLLFKQKTLTQAHQTSLSLGGGQDVDLRMHNRQPQHRCSRDWRAYRSLLNAVPLIEET